jgi:hypothetical protein
VSSPSQDSPDLEALADELIADAEEVDALPVPVRGRGLGAAVRAHRAVARERTVASLPTVQAAAVAAGSFVAGAAVAGLVHRRHRRSPAASAGRSLARSARKGAGPRGALQIVGSRTLLVDVHLLGIPDVER